ncbi:hypothetical protein [Pseudomonas cannabina]|nr:hypothetical protein [Pseudomonas cannabina]
MILSWHINAAVKVHIKPDIEVRNGGNKGTAKKPASESHILQSD